VWQFSGKKDDHIRQIFPHQTQPIESLSSRTYMYISFPLWIDKNIVLRKFREILIRPRRLSGKSILGKQICTRPSRDVAKSDGGKGRIAKKLLKIIYKEIKKALFTCKEINNVFGVDLWA